MVCSGAILRLAPATDTARVTPAVDLGRLWRRGHGLGDRADCPRKHLAGRSDHGRLARVPPTGRASCSSQALTLDRLL